MENENAIATRSDFLQMMPIEQMKEQYESFKKFVEHILADGKDFGKIPGTEKPTLYKAGAEKLRYVYAVGVEFTAIENIVDIKNGYVDYTYRCTAKSPRGQILSQCEGNCNSKEVKYGYLWKRKDQVPAGIDINTLQQKVVGGKQTEFAFAINKKETGGSFGKPASYWQKWDDAIQTGKAKSILKPTKTGKMMDAWEIDEEDILYRVPNPDVIGLKNTIMKMAQKRAFVGAIMLATGASEFFTQDIEDMEIDGEIFSEKHPEVDASNGTKSAVVDIPHEEVTTIVDTSDMPPPMVGESPIAGSSDLDQSQKTAEQKKEVLDNAGKSTTKIPGHWYAKLEKCKTPDDVDALAIKNKETLQANPELKALFGKTKAQRRLAMENFAKEAAEQQTPS